MSAGDGLLSLTEHFADTVKYCAHCRQDLRECKSLRCSRCRVVHYCSRDCQKSNFSLHKASCKQIHGLRQQLDGDGASCTEDERKARRFDLAYTMVTLGYKSTDTLERGKHIYECALLEYHTILRHDPFYIGACESVALLLALLGHDGLCLTLIHFMLHPPPLGLIEQGRDDLSMDGDDLSREGSIRFYSRATAELDDDVWIYGPPGTELTFSEYDKIRDIIPKYWGANVFLVPLMLIKMRQSVGAPSPRLKEETVEICRQVQYSTDFLLPVLRSLFPDSQQRWGKEEVCGLLAHVDYRKLDPEWDEDDAKPYESNRWENSCFVFWMMLKDCYAFTPGILDVLDTTIKSMTELRIRVIPEDPDAPTSVEYTDFISYMAEQQR